MNTNQQQDQEAIRSQLLTMKPATPRQLHRWVQWMLGLRVPHRPRIAGHASPFDYLRHAFFEDARQHRHAIVWAARGSGKTMLGAVATLLDMIFKPGIRICILGGSFEQSSRMHEHLRSMLSSEAISQLVDGAISRDHVQLRNGSSVHVLSQSERSVRGMRVHRLRCDEVELFKPEIWDAAQLITRSGTCRSTFVRAGIEALSTMHKPFGMMSSLVRKAHDMDARVFRWGAIDVLEPCPINRTCERCDLFDAVEGGCAGCAKVPSDAAQARRHMGFLRIDDAIDQKRRVPPATWRSEMLCREPDVSDSVYPEFDALRHVADDDPPASSSSRWIGGIDFGYRAPTAIIIAQLDGKGVLHVVDEIIESGCRAHDLIERTQAVIARRDARIEFFGVDPAGMQRNDQTGLSTITLWRRAGFVIRARASRIESGIEAVRSRLASGTDVRMRIHRRCTRLIRAMREYHYPPNRTGEALPVKDGPDHACDALRYMIVNLDSSAGAAQCRSY